MFWEASCPTFEQVVEYVPNPNELLVILGVYCIGALALTVLCKVAAGVRAENGDAATSETAAVEDSAARPDAADGAREEVPAA